MADTMMMGAPPVDAMTPPGNTAPASVAPSQGGQRMQGIAVGNLALKLLERCLSLVGATSDEGQDVAKAIASLGRRFAQVSKDITEQEAKLIGAESAPVGEPTPQNISAFQSMIRSRLPGAAA